jgi:two-component system response regulator GlrR
MSPHRLLFIGADAAPSQVGVSTQLAEAEGFHVHQISWSALELESLRHSEAHAVLAVIGSVHEQIRRFLAYLRERPVPMPTLAIFQAEAGQTELRAVAEVVDDFVVIPVQASEIACRLRRMLGPVPSEAEALRARLNQEYGLTQIVTQNPAFLKIIETIPKIASSEAAVLITGETGVGKELCARAIHHLSDRHAHPFIPMDCGALPENLMENEIFGHVRGAYTGADVGQRGLVALAEKGTLFLDEVDSLTLSAQAKLLRLLQERSYRPLGGDRFCRSDARVIAATNGNLEQLLKDGKFRRDLYYRLDILQIHIPPLRERRGDIALLAQRVLDSVAQDSRGVRKRLTNSALRKLEFHDWPGNVRELFNVLQRAAILSEAPELGPQDFVIGSEDAKPLSAGNGRKFRLARAQAIEKFEKAYVAELMEKHRGNITRAALEAGKDRRAFGRLVGKYQVEHRALPNRDINDPLLGRD